MTKTRKSNAGRKYFDGKNKDDVLAKLRDIWTIGGSDAEAALHADISASTLERYLKREPEISVLRDKLKDNPILIARRRVVKGLDESYANSMDYLKRKRKNEFGDAMKVDVDENLKEILEKVNNIVP